jgi:hypothetical protein
MSRPGKDQTQEANRSLGGIGVHIPMQKPRRCVYLHLLRVQILLGRLGHQLVDGFSPFR